MRQTLLYFVQRNPRSNSYSLWLKCGGSWWRQQRYIELCAIGKSLEAAVWLVIVQSEEDWIIFSSSGMV